MSIKMELQVLVIFREAILQAMQASSYPLFDRLKILMKIESSYTKEANSLEQDTTS
jgi:hypothetical protein